MPLNINKLDDKTGFNIGWDWYGYRLKYPDVEPDCESFKQGYNAAKERFVTLGEHDRFIRKMLHLRMNAWRRGRIFSEQITAEFLKEIDADTCPITLIKLTHSQETDSNWSVDRILNDSGYVTGNLMVMSTKANYCKGNKTYEEICNIAFDKWEGNEIVDGLSVYEWRRMALICSCLHNRTTESGEIKFGYGVAPCVCMVPKHVVINPSIGMQMAISMKAAGSGVLYDKIASKMRKEVKKRFNGLVNDCRKFLLKNRLEPLDIWHNPRLFGTFMDLFKLMNEEELNSVMMYSHSRVRIKHEIAPEEDTWSIKSRGYMLERNI